MIQKITDIAGMTAAAMLLLAPTAVVLLVIFTIVEGLLWSMLCFTR